MNNKKLALALIVVGLIIVLGILYLMFFYNFNQVGDIRLNNNQVRQEQDESDNSKLRETESNQSRDVSSQEDINRDTPKSPMAKEDVKENDIKKMAESFAERLGSYSNHSDFSNISNLQISMTQQMKERYDDYLEKKRKQEYSGIYYGITTKALISKAKNFDKKAGEAEIMVTTQRRETTGSKDKQDTKTYKQDINIEFKKVNKSWKVDSIEWQ